MTRSIDARTPSIWPADERPRAGDRDEPWKDWAGDGEEDGVVEDLYGNDVASALAEYQLDRTGSLYELHSPQTELPRLKPPRG